MEDLPISQVDTEDAARYGDLQLVLLDLQDVVAACERTLSLLAEKSEDHLLLESLWTTALVKYVRCFSSGKRFGVAEAELDDLEGEPRAVHDHFKNIRDKHIAHSVNPLEQVKVGVVLGPTGKIEGIAHIIGRNIVMGAEHVDTLRRLAAALGNKVAVHVEQRREALLAWAREQPSASFTGPRPRVTVPSSETFGKPRK